MSTTIPKKRFDLEGLRITPKEKEVLEGLFEYVLSLPVNKQRRVFELSQLAYEARQNNDEESVHEIVEVIAEVLFREPREVHGVSVGEGVSTAGDKAVRGHRNWVAKQIRRLRCEAKMTQEQLAEKAGVPQSHISRLENGEHAPTYLTIEKIANALGVAPGVIDPTFD